MEKKLLSLIGVLIILFSCKQTKTQKTDFSAQNKSSELKIEPKNSSLNISIKEQYIENDSLCILMEKKLIKHTVESNYELKTEPRINKHDQRITDTIKTWTKGRNEITTYSHLDKEWICSAKIRNSKFKFLDSVGVGINKQTLETILKTKLNSDIIQIGDLEGNSIFTFKFKFKYNNLMSIDYQGYVD